MKVKRKKLEYDVRPIHSVQLCDSERRPQRWANTASVVDVVRIAGYEFDYGIDTLQDLQDDGINVPSSTDYDYSWGFYKCVKGKMCHLLRKKRKERR